MHLIQARRPFRQQHVRAETCTHQLKLLGNRDGMVVPYAESDAWR